MPMEMLLKLLALCVTGAVLALLLREEKQIVAIFVIVALLLCAAPLLLQAFRQIFDFFQTLVELSGLSSQLFSPLLKVLGIAAVTRIGALLCEEAESDTAAALLEMGGTCCALLAALPLMTMVLELMQEML